MAIDAEPREHRRGLRLFSRTTPVTADRAGMQPPVWDDLAVEALPEFFAGGGSAQATLFVDPDGTDAHCPNLVWLRLASNYQLPRHSHTGDCLYYVVSGEVHLGKRTVGPGGGFFVPSGAPYSYAAGPDGAEVLEFRATGRPVDSRILESPAGWRRILEGVRANRDRWREELAPYARWCRSATSVACRTPAGERRSLSIDRPPG